MRLSRPARVTLLALAACAGCLSSSQPPPQSNPPDSAGQARKVPAAAVVDEKSRTEAKPVATVDQPSTLPAFLEPTSNPLCPASFPRGYVFVGKTESETQALFRVIWRDGQSRGDYVVAVSPDTPDAEAARCIAIGPHRDLNIGNWCCR